jgi:hypothetical protein
LIALTAFAAGVLLGGWLPGERIARERMVGRVERVLIEEGPIAFDARIDTGATVSSVHARDIEVIDGNPDHPPSNLGRMVRFTLVNAGGASAPVAAPIALVRGISSADCREWRYHVYLSVAFRGHRHRVLVNLNDRSRKAERLLLGRNWLRHGYVVDLARAKTDTESRP